MKKQKTVFVCQSCGYESPKWMGQCICGQWNTFVEETLQQGQEQDRRSRKSAGSKANKPISLKSLNTGEFRRQDTGISELNRVLGGGLVEGSLTLISGEPGIGKSTLILQAAGEVASRHGPVLYVSGEESVEQVKLRADRVCRGNLENLYLMAETDMDSVVSVAGDMGPKLIVVDSIQTMYTADMDSPAGSVSQVRACADMLMRLGKVQDIPVFIVAHVTKSGELAGPKILEHLVDCVLSFEGERSGDLRLLRAVKNRFGSTNEIGAFDMAEEGLAEIKDLSARLLADMDEDSEGAVASAVYEGSRPLLIEVQALTAPAVTGFPGRTAVGMDRARLNMVLAVLERKAGVSLAAQDVYLNVAGGIKPESTSFDLAAALAVVSAYRGKPPSVKTVAIGEVSLTGAVRGIQHLDKLINEAAKIGFGKIIVPEKGLALRGAKKSSVQVVGVKNLREAISQL